jgi:para-nitrobenzyl esterase
MQVVREVAAGRLGGELVSSGAVARFLGVPFAGAIDGARRFVSAAPVTAWSGVRECTSFGPAAPQPPMEFGPGERAQMMVKLTAEMQATEPQDENCLVLNVWAPTSTGADRPVMLSIHGGAHTVGSGAMPVFDGAWLAEHRDVVVVTVNHRLGALGYLYLAEMLGEEYASSGNVGNLDLVCALEWVRDNIAAFGGDPGNVTIFGESGGGAKVCTLMAMPAASGLFHRAIVQSGPKLGAMTPDAANRVTTALLKELDLGTDARALLRVATDRLVAAQLRVLGGPLGLGTRTFGPVVDGVALPRRPFEPDAPEVSSSVPLLIGTTKDEMTFFTHPNEAFDALDHDGAVGVVQQLVGDGGPGLYAMYRATRPGATAQQLVTAVMTDRFRVGSIRIAERKAALGAAPVWMYRFDFDSDVLDGALGAPHAMDIAFTFGNPDVTPLSGTRPDRHQVADHMSSAWTAFARTGSPQTPDLPTWPAYEPTRRATLIFDSVCHVVDDPDGTERQGWDNLPAGV